MPDTPRARTGRDSERGVALVELTIVVPLMLMLFLMIFDFGRGLMVYVNVKDAARDGARAAMQNDQPCTAANPSIANAVQVEVEPGRTPSYTVAAVAGGTACAVTTTYDFQLILPVINDGVTLPLVGQIGPFWDGTLTETAVGMTPPSP